MNFDNINSIRQLDKENLLGSIEALPKQCQQTWEDLKKIEIPFSYKEVNNIVLNGMGGSALGGRIIESLYYDSLRVPFKVINSYTLPRFVDEKTLYILSSYSGTTEEVLATGNEALKRKAKCLGITTGATLGEYFKENRIPHFLINPKHNPCGKPRMALGYSILGIMGLIGKCGLVELKNDEIQKVIETLNKVNRLYNINVWLKDNIAKKIAKSFWGKVVILVGAEFLAGSVHGFRNQLHENSKNFADYFLISELNHHLMEGLAQPKTNPRNLIFLFLQSPDYHPLIKKRFEITKEVVKKNKIEFLEYTCFSATKLNQAFEIEHFGSYVNFYLAMLNQIDPSPIPWVDYFKDRMAK